MEKPNPWRDNNMRNMVITRDDHNFYTCNYVITIVIHKINELKPSLPGPVMVSLRRAFSLSELASRHSNLWWWWWWERLLGMFLKQCSLWTKSLKYPCLLSNRIHQSQDKGPHLHDKHLCYLGSMHKVNVCLPLNPLRVVDDVMQLRCDAGRWIQLSESEVVLLDDDVKVGHMVMWQHRRKNMSGDLAFL